MKFILGKKVKMTQIFKEGGKAVGVTVVKCGPCYVTQIKNDEKDGYQALQIGFEETKKYRLPEVKQGHLKKTKKLLKNLIEFRTSEKDNNKAVAPNVGDKITVDIFEEGDKVQATGMSKGKGFQGVVKRHGFSGSPASHGHKDQNRMPGSIGATDPARVFKGKKMPGHMGYKQVTVKNLKVVKVDSKRGELYISGGLPGAPGTLLKIKSI